MEDIREYYRNKRKWTFRRKEGEKKKAIRTNQTEGKNGGNDRSTTKEFLKLSEDIEKTESRKKKEPKGGKADYINQNAKKTKTKNNKPKKQRKRIDFYKVKLIVTLTILVTFLLVDAYGLIMCLSYLNKYNIETEVGQEVDIDEYKPNLNGHDTSWFYNRKVDNIDWNHLGVYKVRYIPKLFGISHTLCINVVDTTAPEIKIDDIGENDYFASIDDVISRDYVAIDNYDGDVTDKVEVEYLKENSNNYTVFYTAEDSSGNKSVVKQEVKLAKGLVALTFDDGPSTTVTPQILDVLKKYDVKATFFVLGFEGKEDLIKREYDEGHTIACHGYTHDYSIYTSAENVLNNFKKVEDMITEVTGGESSKIVRFPGGSSNTVSKKYRIGVMTEAVKAVEDAGYIYYDWNVDSDDAGSAGTSKEIVDNVTSAIRMGRLNVVLMHDAESKTETLKALEEIILFCKKNDYVLVNLNSSYNPVHHLISN